MSKITIPKSVRVGAIDYEILYPDIIIIDENTNYLGACSTDECEIRILKSLKQQTKESVFIHELVHAMFDQAGYKNHNEEMIERLGCVLHQVLRDNDFCSVSEGCCDGQDSD